MAETDQAIGPERASSVDRIPVQASVEVLGLAVNRDLAAPPLDDRRPLREFGVALLASRTTHEPALGLPATLNAHDQLGQRCEEFGGRVGHHTVVASRSPRSVSVMSRAARSPQDPHQSSGRWHGSRLRPGLRCRRSQRVPGEEVPCRLTADLSHRPSEAPTHLCVRTEHSGDDVLQVDQTGHVVASASHDRREQIGPLAVEVHDQSAGRVFVGIEPAGVGDFLLSITVPFFASGGGGGGSPVRSSGGDAANATTRGRRLARGRRPRRGGRAAAGVQGR